MKSNTRYHTAIHEAGHAVISEVLEMSCMGVSCVPKKGRLGSCAADNSDSSPHRKAIYGYAGHAAVVSILNIGTMSDRSAYYYGAKNDFTEAANDLNHDSRRMRYAKHRSLSLVRRHCKAIERVAQLLCDKNRSRDRSFLLDGQTISAIVAAYQMNHDPEQYIKALDSGYNQILKKGGSNKKQKK